MTKVKRFPDVFGTGRTEKIMALDILIVDDERDICDLVAGVMEDEGYEARTASDSDAALEACLLYTSRCV